jgi:membrane fusion protein, multidrug efflux system
MDLIFRRFSTTIGLISVAVATVCLASCSSADSKASAARPASPPPVPVAVSAARRMDLPVFLTGLGSVTPSSSVSVKSRVDGQLTQVAFKEGQQVQKGQLLAVIDPRPYEVQLAQARATLAKDQAQLRDARLNLDRFRELLKVSGAVSQQQVDTQSSLADQLEAATHNDEALISSAQLQITYCHIIAPISGRIGLRLVDVGNIVHAADPNPLLIITQLQPIAVVFSLPEDQLPAVAQHMKSGALGVLAYSRDDQNQLATGRLETIDNQIDPTTGTGKLKAMFENRNGELWPNQFVNVHLMLETRKNVIVVPSASVQRGPQGTFAYVVKADKTAEARPVTVDLAQGNLSAVGQGLSEGENVVTDGQDKLQNGSRVEPRSSSPVRSDAGAGPRPGAGGGQGASGTNPSGANSRPGGSPNPGGPAK